MLRKFLTVLVIFLFVFSFINAYAAEVDKPYYTKKFEVARDCNNDFVLRTSFYKFDKSLDNYAIFMIRNNEEWDEPLFYGDIEQKTRDDLIKIFKEKYKPILDKIDKKIGLIISFWPVSNEAIIYFDEEFEDNETFHEDMKNRINKEIE